MWKSFVLELHGEWSEFADECIGLFSSFERFETTPAPEDRSIPSSNGIVPVVLV